MRVTIRADVDVETGAEIPFVAESQVAIDARRFAQRYQIRRVKFQLRMQVERVDMVHLKMFSAAAILAARLY